MNNIEEMLLEVELALKLIHQQIHTIRLELTQLKHSNSTINSSKETVVDVDSQNRTTARR